jgi:hypothetical protein
MVVFLWADREREIEMFNIMMQIISTGLIVWLVAYFKQKGKYLAAKQDIVELTDKVEKIRTVYQASLEEIKSELKVDGSYKIDINERAYEALLTFGEDCLVLFHEKLAFSLGDLPLDHGKSLNEIQGSTLQLIRKLYSGSVRLSLYFDDQAILSAADDIVKIAYGIQKIFRSDFQNVTTAVLFEFEPAFESLAQGDKDKFKKAVENFRNAANDFGAKMEPQIGSLALAIDEYRTAIKKYLKNILKKGTPGIITQPIK